MAKNLNYNIIFKANTKEAEGSLKELQQQIMALYTNSVQFKGHSFKEAAQNMQQLSKMLQVSIDKTGKLNLTKFNEQLKKANTTVSKLSKDMLSFGFQGQKTFASFASSITSAQKPLRQTSNLINEMWTTLKNTIRWQVSSAALGSLTSAVSSAVSYAHELDSALRDIRIVSDESSESMKHFAQDASKAAKRLSSTTKDYAEGALIYYQQGKPLYQYI